MIYNGTLLDLKVVAYNADENGPLMLSGRISDKQLELFGVNPNQKEMHDDILQFFLSYSQYKRRGSQTFWGGSLRHVAVC